MNKVTIARPERKHTALRRALAEPGRTLPDPVRVTLEAKFAADFRRIRIHTGSLADEAARSLAADALTFGDHILFRAGMWRPETREGFDLLAHEAAHTLQHSGPLPDCSEASVSQPGDVVEREADAAADRNVSPTPREQAVIARRVAGIALRDRQRTDPARTVEEIGRTLLLRIRADSQDRSGRVRNQLIRMEDNLRRDVLQWLERRMESHEWRRFVELLAEPAPAGIEGTEDRQLQAAAPPAAEPAPATAETGGEEPAETTAERVEEGAAPTAATEQPAAGAEEVAATAEPQEAGVAQPRIESEAATEPVTAGEAAGPAPTAETQGGPVPTPSVPAPAAEPPESAVAAPPQTAEPQTPAAEGAEATATEPATIETETQPTAGAVEEDRATQESRATEEGKATEAGTAPTETAPAEQLQPEPTAAQSGEQVGAPTAAAEPPLTEEAVPAAEPASESVAAEPVSESVAAEPSESETEPGPAVAPAESAAPSEEVGGTEAPENAGAEIAQIEQAPAGATIGQAEVAETSEREPAAAESSTAQSPADQGQGEAQESPAAAGDAVPPSLLGEFAGEPTENEAGAPGGGGGGAGGGGSGAAPEAAAEPAAPAVPQDNPVSAMQSIGTMRVAEASQAMGSAGAAVSAQMGRQRDELASRPPTIERPTGSPQGAEGATPGNVPASPPGPNPAPIPTAAAGQSVPLPAAPSPPQPGAPVTQSVAPPRVAGTAQGQLSEADARRVQDAVNNVPVTDEALNVDAGAVPDLPLEGDADPNQADAQRTNLLDSAATTQQDGAAEAAAPMGEGHIYPDAQAGTIRPEAAAGPCGGGQTGQQESAAGAPDAGVAAVAEEERGDEVRQAATGAAGELGQQQQQQVAEQQQANTDCQQQVDQAIDDNARQQSDERTRAREQVDQSRQQWRDGQRTAVDTARTESEQAVGDARRDVSAEQSRAYAEASGHITTGNQEITRTRTDSEQQARSERERARREADGGVLSWLASSITSFFNRLRDAIHAVFDAARRAVRAAIETAQRLARGVIDLARRAVVGLIRAAGALLVAIGDRLLAAFPELRARFRAAIEAVVNAAVAAVNALFDLLERGIMALLNALLAAINAILCAYEAIYMAIVNTVANAVQGAINFARSAIAALGAFAELVKDIAANPGQWLRNLGSSIMDGLRNHLWAALKSAVRNWFNETVEGIIGMGRMLLDLLRRGGLTLRKIAGFVWQAILSALPGIIIQFLIERLISMLVPAAAAIMMVIQGLVAAWGAVQRIIQAFQLFFTFLKAVKAGGAGPQFAAALAASAVALIQFLAMFLLARLGRAAGKVAGKLKALAQRLMAFFRRVGRAAGRVLRRAGRVVRRGLRAVGRLTRRGLRAVGRVLRRTRIGRAILRGVRRIQRGIGRLRRRFRRWRERRRQRRRESAQDKLNRIAARIRPRVHSMVRRGIPRILLSARLLAWRALYRLSELAVRGHGARPTLVMRVNPSVEDALAGMTDNDLRDAVHDVVTRMLASRDVQQTSAFLGERGAQTSAVPDLLSSQSGAAGGPLQVPPGAGYPGLVRHLGQERPFLASGQTRHFEYGIGESTSRLFEAGPQYRASIANQLVRPGRTYPAVTQELRAVMERTGTSESGVMNALSGFIGTGELPAHLARDASARDAIAHTAHLMFVREGVRNPSALAHGMMTADLIAAGPSRGGMSMAQAFGEPGAELPGGGGRFPMSMHGAQAASRELQEERQRVAAGQPPGTRSREAQELARREGELIRQWVLLQLRTESLIFETAGEARAEITRIIERKVQSFFRLRRRAAAAA